MLIALLALLFCLLSLIRTALRQGRSPYHRLKEAKPGGFRSLPKPPIRHQRTDPGCPWQNGRVERFFGTLKEKLDRLAVDSFEALNAALVEFRFFYNGIRSHQNLRGSTPAEAWAGVDPFADSFRKEYWFEAWDGLLQGYYLRR